MSNSLIFYPVLGQVFLTFVILFSMGRNRVSSIRKGETKIKDVALGQSAWPQRVTQFSKSFNSQFQLPVLFFIACIFAQVNNQVDQIMVGLAWAFVISRTGHAWIHVTSNNVGKRFNAFTIGFFILATMWGYLTYKIIMAGG